MDARRLLVAGSAALAVAAALAAPGCGPSAAAKAYAAYEAKAEPLLDREIVAWKKLVTLIGEQSSGDAADAKRLEEVVRTESAPFYAGFLGQAKALAPGDPSLDRAQAAFVRYAEARQEFVEAVLDGLEAMALGDPSGRLTSADGMLQSTVTEYATLMETKGVPPDSRFAELIAAQTEFQQKGLEPLVEGRGTVADIEQRLRARILPRLRELRGEKYAEDAEGKALKAAVFATAAFFEAVVEELPRMGASAEFKLRTETLAREGDEALKRFRDEMAAARRKH
jgi:hypothetical protein